MTRLMETLGLLVILCVALGSAQGNANQSSQVASSYAGNGLGEDCTHDATLCGRGLLCLPRYGHTPGVGPGVCRRPVLNDACDDVATCDSSNLGYNLTCALVQYFNTGESIDVLFPGKLCQRGHARGEQCSISNAACIPGLVCGTTGNSFSSVCVTPTQMQLGQDCSKNDCAKNLFCQNASDGSKRCINPIAKGQSCNPKQFKSGVNPCADPYVCVNGKCSTGLPAGSPCVIPEYPGNSYSPSTQCDTAKGLLCVKSSTGRLQCLNTVGPVQACGQDGGCFNSGFQCIKNYCGIPNGGQGDVCSSASDCRPGLKCLNASVSGPGFRCHAVVGAGESCDAYTGFVTCATGLKCNTNGFSICERGPVPIGGRCVVDQDLCAPGLTCLPNGPISIYPGDVGVCSKVANLGEACNPSGHVVCNQGYFGDGTVSPALACVSGKCVQSAVGNWDDVCGPGTGVSCTQKDAVGKLECSNGTYPLSIHPNQQSCVHVNLSIGQQCSLENGFGPNDVCASGLQCYGVYDPYRTPAISFEKTVCVQFAVDGQQCNYNQLIGCQNANSSCVRGICTVSRA